MANDKNDEDREQQGTARQHQERTTGSEQPQGGQSSGIWPGPDVMLGAWTSWMESGSARAQPGVDIGKPWWQLTPDDLAGEMLAGGIEQLHKTLAKDPLLRSVDQMWNANPLRDVVPIDWSEVARALRTVWLRSLGRPATTVASVVELNASLWRSAAEAWNDAGRHWLRGNVSDASTPGPSDKRFAAPEWHTNPAYRTLKEVYLLASDWLLKQSNADDDLDDAERQRINFHLRQFVDAMSPTLMLMLNPTALHKAIETGGASVVAGARNLMTDLNAGRLTMVDTEAFAPGRNLALTPGKVVYRNRLIELSVLGISRIQRSQVSGISAGRKFRRGLRQAHGFPPIPEVRI